MFVIFLKEKEQYYSHDKKDHWTTEVEKAAAFKTLESAKNHTSSMLKDKIDKVTYIPVVIKDGKPFLDEVPDYTQEEAEAAYEELRKAAEAFGAAAKKIPAIIKYYTKVRSDQDKLEQDITHKIEFSPFSSILYVKMGRMLKKSRVKRREAKDRVHYATLISECRPENLLEVHNDYNETIEGRVYEPRIAPELFN